jgi:hypothetical protein
MGEFKKVTVRKDTKDKLDQICKVLGKTRSKFLSELITNIWELVAINEAGNLEYDISVLGSYVQIQFYGQTKIRIGETKFIEGESPSDETKRIVKEIEEGKEK